MKNLLKPHILPLFTLGAGGLGLALRVWLLSTGVDEKGLLLTGHPASALSFILAALVLAIVALAVRSLRPIAQYSQLFPASGINAAGCAVGAATLLYTAFNETIAGQGPLRIILLILSLAAAVALALTGVYRRKGKRPHFLLATVVTVYLMLHTVLQCRTWGTEPQLQRFFFPLMASVFLLLTGYQHTVLNICPGSRRWFVFYNQAALFFCCLSANTENKLFYLGMAVWMTSDMCSLQQTTEKLPPVGEET